MSLAPVCRPFYWSHAIPQATTGNPRGLGCGRSGGCYYRRCHRGNVSAPGARRAGRTQPCSPVHACLAFHRVRFGVRSVGGFLGGGGGSVVRRAGPGMTGCGGRLLLKWFDSKASPVPSGSQLNLLRTSHCAWDKLCTTAPCPSPKRLLVLGKAVAWQALTGTKWLAGLWGWTEAVGADKTVTRGLARGFEGSVSLLVGTSRLPGVRTDVGFQEEVICIVYPQTVRERTVARERGTVPLLACAAPAP